MGIKLGLTSRGRTLRALQAELWKVFGYKREEIAGEPRKKTSEQPGKLYCTRNRGGQLKYVMGWERGMHRGGDNKYGRASGTE